MKPSLRRRLSAEFFGTLLLVATVVGSGIMAERLANGNVALALLANTIATGTMLVALYPCFWANFRCTSQSRGLCGGCPGEWVALV